MSGNRTVNYRVVVLFQKHTPSASEIECTYREHRIGCTVLPCAFFIRSIIFCSDGGWWMVDQ